MCDRVLVLEKGELKEFDSPSRLLADTSSTFYSLAKESGLVQQFSNGQGAGTSIALPTKVAGLVQQYLLAKPRRRDQSSSTSQGGGTSLAVPAKGAGLVQQYQPRSRGQSSSSSFTSDLVQLLHLLLPSEAVKAIAAQLRIPLAPQLRIPLEQCSDSFSFLYGTGLSLNLKTDPDQDCFFHGKKFTTAELLKNFILERTVRGQKELM